MTQSCKGVIVAEYTSRLLNARVRSACFSMCHQIQNTMHYDVLIFSQISSRRLYLRLQFKQQVCEFLVCDNASYKRKPLRRCATNVCVQILKEQSFTWDKLSEYFVYTLIQLKVTQLVMERAILGVSLYMIEFKMRKSVDELSHAQL